jgi:glycine cleavage system H protein
MYHIPSELRYTSSHEWVRLEDDNEVVVGITSHAQRLLGDMVFVDLPTPGSALFAGDDCVIVESVKAATDVFSPVSGKILAVNDELERSPELINQDPYGAGWLYRMKIQEPDELNSLLDADGYRRLLDSGE